MLKIVKILLAVIVVLAGIVIVKNSPDTSQLIWNISNEGSWLLPLVLVAAVLDSVHPCSFSILFITIAFLFGMQMERKKILEIGGAYVAGIFIAYLFIGLGILKVLHLFDTPHFMGKLGAGLLIAFGVLNIVNEFFPKFPIKLKIPDATHTAMGKLLRKASFPAAFILGVLVGICQFPCMGGPYLMVIGLLRDQMTYTKGFAYLLLYNIILIAPLVTVLWIAADKIILEKMQEWKISNVGRVKLWAGLAMIIMGIVILYI
jgi:cytochrome c biogenesis protein CcdA